MRSTGVCVYNFNYNRLPPIRKKLFNMHYILFTIGLLYIKKNHNIKKHLH